MKPWASAADQRLHALSPALPVLAPPLAYPAHFQVRLVSANGGVRWKSAWVNCSHVLAGEYMGFEEVEDGIWAMYYGPILLGRFHECDLVIIGTHDRNKLKNPRPGLLPMSPV